MDAPQQQPTAGFSFTASAAEKIAELVETSEFPAFGLRVGVRGGGCSGYTYFMEVVPEDQVRPARDRVFEAHGARVVVDERSLKFLEHTRLDFARSLMGAAFRFENPDAKRSCGCGSSFAV